VGGDEFLVSVWHAQEEGPSAERVLERVAEVLREHPVVLPNGEEALLTFSGGVGWWQQPEDDSERLLSKADEALYRAKGEGGNTVVRAD
jgi:diguanylate cyclase (GGDEF)-like protein